MKKPKKELLIKAKELLGKIKNEEEINSLTSILNSYMSKPTKSYELALETYCEMLEISLDLDELEAKNGIFAK